LKNKTVLIIAAITALLFYSAGLYSYHFFFAGSQIVAAIAPSKPVAPPPLHSIPESTITYPVPRQHVDRILKHALVYPDTNGTDSSRRQSQYVGPDSVELANNAPIQVGAFRTAHGDSVKVAFSPALDSFMISQWPGPIVVPDTIHTMTYAEVPFFRAQPLVFLGQDSRYSGNGGVGFEMEISKNFRISIEAGFALKSTPFYGLTWRYVFPWIKFG